VNSQRVLIMKRTETHQIISPSQRVVSSVADPSADRENGEPCPTHLDNNAYKRQKFLASGRVRLVMIRTLERLDVEQPSLDHNAVMRRVHEIEACHPTRKFCMARNLIFHFVTGGRT